MSTPRTPEPWLIEDILSVGGMTTIYGRPKVGKALALDTPILTPSGWRTMVELQPGDQVFGANGMPTTITGISDVQLGRPCFRVTFGDGSAIIADAEHLWEVTRSGKQCVCCSPPKLLTTQELVDTGTTTNGGRNGVRKAKWHVRLPEPLQYPAASPLPLDPYLLGTWLGDGTRTVGAITTADPEIAEAWATAGWDIRKQPSNAYVYGIRGLMPTLRGLGVLDNKHIPASYLTASVQDRVDLLRGLLDTDGHADDHSATFYNTNERLALEVQALAIGLGLKVTWRVKRAMLRGVDHGPCFCVRMRCHFNPFRLERKAKKITLNHKERYWSITAIEPVESVPVKCITVAAHDHLYLAGPSCLPTHNSFAALGMAIAISQEHKDWLGFPVYTHGTVAYVQIDVGGMLWSSHYCLPVAPFVADRSKIYMVDREMAPFPFNILGAGGAWLKGALAKLSPPPVLVIIDTIRRMHTGDENESGHMQNVMSALAAATAPAALLIVSHARKDNPAMSESVLNDVRGTSGFTAAVDTIVKLTSAKPQEKGVLLFEGRTDSGRRSLRRHPSGLWLATESTEDAVKGVLTAFPSASRNAQAVALAERLGVSHRTAVRRLEEFREGH